MKPIKNLSEFRYFYLSLFLLWMILVVILSLVSFTGFSIKMVKSYQYADKWVHFIFYLVMTFLLMQFLYKETRWFDNFYKRAFCVFLVVSSIGIVVEYLQDTLTISRRFDVKDIYFNVFGIVIAILFMKMKKTLKFRK